LPERDTTAICWQSAAAGRPPAPPSPSPNAAAQAAAAPVPAKPPVKAWSGSVSAGISLTAGNKDTSNFNASFDVVRDPKNGNVFKSDALYLLGRSERNVTGDQLRFGMYDEHRFNSHFFAFAQVRYLRDRFKEIDYLVAPATGMGYKIYESPNSSLGLAAGLGGVWEKDKGRRTPPSGSLNVDQKLTHKLSTNATITQAIAALWKTTNFADSLYTLRATLAAGLTARSQLKVEVVDTYKNRVTSGARKNDVALVTGLVFKL
jgi:putative salt-induced outer membrane protein YdiY